MDNNLSEIEMPLVFVIKNRFYNFSKIYGAVILIAIFTTAISAGMSFFRNMKIESKRVIMEICALSIVIAPFGFSNLVRILFPVYGVIGLLQIYFIIKH